MSLSFERSTSEMGPRVFTINLFGDNETYFPGSVIEGNVVLELSKPKSMKRLEIVLSGNAYVHWSEEKTTGTGDNKRTETVHYSAADQFFEDMTVHLWGNGSDSEEMAAGEHEFPFSFQLPADGRLPSSYESDFGTTGYIRYTLKATIVRSGLKFNHNTKRLINVNEIIDVNKPWLTKPLSKSKEKTLCCLWCASGPLTLSATIDRGAYCPGESISITTEAENHSNRRVNSVRATLKQVVGMFAGGKSRGHSKNIARIEDVGIEAHGSSNWSNKLLLVPSTIPTIDILSCHILTVTYVLTITLGIPRAVDLHVEIPVKIGNVPYNGEPTEEYGFAMTTRDALHDSSAIPYLIDHLTTVSNAL